MQTSDPAATRADLEPAPDSAYWRFYELVALGQLTAWLPPEPSRVLDLSGGRFAFHDQLLARGHDVVQVPGPTADGLSAATVIADPQELDWVDDDSVDAVLAEGNALSLCLAAELTAEELLRVLRPGGRLLLVVDSLLLGMARLADQERWAELADVPSADVVLVPERSGRITRCFWPEELAALLDAAGFEVDWIRPRTVLSPSAVERALAAEDAQVLTSLVQTELALTRDRQGESTGMHLVASARRPG